MLHNENKLENTQPPDFWSARATKSKQTLKNPATRFLIRKGYWKKTNSKTPSHQIIDPQGLLKENKL